MSRPTLSETMSDQSFYNPRENPENLESKKRILYEIEQLFDMQDKDLGLDIIESRSRHSRRIPNRDIYKILKAACIEMSVRPRIVYTGKDVLDMDTAESLINESDKNLETLEPSL